MFFIVGKSLTLVRPFGRLGPPGNLLLGVLQPALQPLVGDVLVAIRRYVPEQVFQVGGERGRPFLYALHDDLVQVLLLGVKQLSVQERVEVRQKLPGVQCASSVLPIERRVVQLPGRPGFDLFGSALELAKDIGREPGEGLVFAYELLEQLNMFHASIYLAT